MDKKSNEDSIKLSKGETKFYKIQCKLKKKKKKNIQATSENHMI